MVRNDNCELCSRCKGATYRCVQQSLPCSGKLMIVTDFPAITSIAAGGLFKADKEKLVRKVLDEIIGYNSKDVYYSYLTKCTSYEKPTETDMAICTSNYFEYELEDINPACILVIGETALKYFLPKSGKISQERGKVYEYKGIPLVATFSPVYVERNRTAFSLFCDDLASAVNLSNGYRPVADSNLLPEVVYINSPAELESIMPVLEDAEYVAFDFETIDVNGKKDGALNPYSPDFRATVLCLNAQAGFSYAIPLCHKESKLSETELLEVFRILNDRFFGNPNIHKVGANVKFDMRVAAAYCGVTDFRGCYHDVAILHYRLDENSKHGLKELVNTYLPMYSGYEKDVSFNGGLIQLAEYCAADADFTRRLFLLFLHKMMKTEPQIYRVYWNYDVPLVKVLFKAEHEGAYIDVNILEEGIDKAEQLLEEYYNTIVNIPEVAAYIDVKRKAAIRVAKAEIKEKIAIYEKKVEDGFRASTATLAKWRAKLSDITTGKKVIDFELNLRSTPQLKDLLYSKAGFGLKPIKDPKQKGKVGTTSKDTLNDLQAAGADETFVQTLLKYKAVSTITNTFLKGILQRVDSEDKIHSTFKMAHVVTGRISSADPNLQNLPSNAKMKQPEIVELVKYIKKAFVSFNSAYGVLQADYSQLELRLIAEFAKDPEMIDAYINGVDLHTKLAKALVGAKYDTYTPDEQKIFRTKAKAGNFGFVYSMQPKSFMEYARLNYGAIVTEDEAIALRKSVITPSLESWHKRYIQLCIKYGYVKTMFGTKRRLPAIYSSDNMDKMDAERQAINSPIQGTGGQLALFTVLMLSLRIHCGYRFMNTVHDSIIAYLRKDLREPITKMIVDTAENPPIEKFIGVKFETDVPIKLDTEYSDDSWGAVKGG